MIEDLKTGTETMCPKCAGTGVYYTEESVGVRVNPCSCEDSQAKREAEEQQFKLYIEWVNKRYGWNLGCS
jgi:DnaJ-class molecular chaperone